MKVLVSAGGCPNEAYAIRIFEELKKEIVSEKIDFLKIPYAVTHLHALDRFKRYVYKEIAIDMAAIPLNKKRIVSKFTKMVKSDLEKKSAYFKNMVKIYRENKDIIDFVYPQLKAAANPDIYLDYLFRYKEKTKSDIIVDLRNMDGKSAIFKKNSPLIVTAPLNLQHLLKRYMANEIKNSDMVTIAIPASYRDLGYSLYHMLSESCWKFFDPNQPNFSNHKDRVKKIILEIEKI